MGEIDKQALSVTVLQPSRAPYRIALFEELAQDFKIKVIYVSEKVSAARSWKVNDTANVTAVDAQSRSINVGSRRFSFSLGTVITAHRGSDVLVTCTNVLELPTYIGSALVARLHGKSVLCLVTINASYKFFKGAGFLARLGNAVLHKAIGLLIRLSDFSLAYSKGGVEESRRYGVDAISSSQYYPLEAEYGPAPALSVDTASKRDADTIIACVVGYLSPRKGVDAFVAMRDRLGLAERIRLLVAGPLPQSDKYVCDLLSRGWHNVEFVGTVDGEQKRALFEKSDVMVFPTKHDSWGYVVNEAMYCGLPVIASPFSEAALDLIDNGRTGWVYHDDESFLHAISGASDPETRRSVATEAQSAVREFNVGAIQAWESALRKAFSRRHGL